MLDEKDLQAIAKLISGSEARISAKMTEEIAAPETRMAEKISSSEPRLKEYVDGKVSTAQSHTLALMEAYFDPRFQALGKKIDLLEEKMVALEDLEDIESRLDVLEAVTRRNVQEIEILKKAQQLRKAARHSGPPFSHRIGAPPTAGRYQ